MHGFDEPHTGWRRLWDAFATDAFTLLISLPLLAVLCGLIYIGAGSLLEGAKPNPAAEQVAWRSGTGR
jgi:hypothetical protein